jgi:hypothetical protein
MPITFTYIRCLPGDYVLLSGGGDGVGWRPWGGKPGRMVVLRASAEAGDTMVM